jgi:endoglucanase
MIQVFSRLTKNNTSFTALTFLLSTIIVVFSSLIILNQTKYVEAQSAPQIANAPVYTDALANSWTNWSWDTTINFGYVDNPATASNKSINITVNKKWGGLYLHNGTGLNPQNYTAVQFRVKSMKAGQKFSLELHQPSDAMIGSPILFTKIGGDPANGQWKTYTVPLSTFGNNTKPIGGIVIEDESEMTKHSYLVDDVVFIAKQGINPTPTQSIPTITPTPTKNPTPTPIQSGPTPTKQPTITPSPTVTAGTPVGINGQLHVCGTKICNQYNKPIQLRGMSSHGLQWFYKCMNTASMDALANDWKADVLRISMYVQEDGYEKDPAGYKTKIDTIVDMATTRGMYVVLDWHILTPGDPLYNVDRAKEFFTYMAQKHGSKNNIIYETANEPNGVSWATIKNYSEQIIPVIRAYDPDAIIIVGTRGWSSFGLADGSNATEIANNPVNATNIMYSFHFYAASHKDDYRNELSWAADRIPVFVTEWGTQDYTGDGANDFISSQAYIDLMASKQISWTNWNYSDDVRGGASFNVGTCPNGSFTGTTNLKPAGAWVREKILNPSDNFPQN